MSVEIIGPSGFIANVDSAGNLYATLQNAPNADLIDAGNSSTATLGSGAAFTGAFHSTQGYAALAVAVDTDQISAATATTGLVVQWSEDGVTVGDSDVTYIIAADLLPIGQGYVFPVKRPYYRIVYTNGASGQGTFRLQSVLKVNAPHGLIGDLTNPLTSNMHAELVRAVLSPVPLVGSALTPVYVAATSQAVLKASPGNLYGAWIVNLATSTATTTNLTMYVHFFNTTTTTSLSTGSWLFALPIASPGVVNVTGAGAGAGLNLPPGSFALANFSSGIVIVINTTSSSNTTASGTAPTGVIWID